jgi:small-conductance mechanosensitive channel
MTRPPDAPILRAVLAWLDRVPSWGLAVAYLVAWVLAAWLAGRVVRRSLERVAKHRHGELAEVLAKSLPRPAAIAVLLVALVSGLRLLPLGQMHLLEVHRLLTFALAVVGVAALMRIAFKAIDAFGRSNPDLRSSAGIGKGCTWIVGLAIIAVIVSDALGVSLAPALTALGVGSLTLALALQDTLANFFAGIYLVVDKPVRPGDFIRVDPSFEGYVESIGWRSAHLRTLTNNLVIIPNSTLSKAVITNFTLPTPHVASNIRVDVTLGADLDKVEDALADEARRSLDIPGVADAPAPSVAMAPGFVDGGVAFTVYFHVRSFADQLPVQHAIRKRVAARLKKEGIALNDLRTSVIKRD